jgi:hypothetical protein
MLGEQVRQPGQQRARQRDAPTGDGAGQQRELPRAADDHLGLLDGGHGQRRQSRPALGADADDGHDLAGHALQFAVPL